MNDDERIEEKRKLSSPTIYEIISREGDEELKRPATSLAWSGVAAGICISFALLAQGFLARYLPETDASTLLIKMGYVFGFLIVIMSRLQLFTENTITVILPLLERRTMRTLMRTARLWGIVFVTNMIGTFIVALMIYGHHKYFGAPIEHFVEISKHAVLRDGVALFFEAIPAGFLIAAMVWMMPTAHGSEFFVLFSMIYLIALGNFAHVVAGSAEAFLLVLTGDASIGAATQFILAAGVGNVIGGTGLFALLAYAQVQSEL
jgi:formate/nitrite transporter FocA (FNT family)